MSLPCPSKNHLLKELIDFFFITPVASAIVLAVMPCGQPSSPPRNADVIAPLTGKIPPPALQGHYPNINRTMAKDALEIMILAI
jgi:hypothetical protein